MRSTLAGLSGQGRVAHDDREKVPDTFFTQMGIG